MPVRKPCRWFWQHEWSRWTLLDVTITSVTGVRREATRQTRECARCGKTQLEDV